MSSDRPAADANGERSDRFDWPGVEQMLRDVSGICQADTRLDEIARVVTERLPCAIAADAACFWTCEPQSGLQRAGETVALNAAGWNWPLLQQPRRALLDAARVEQQSKAILWQSMTAIDGGSIPSTSPSWAIVSPVLHGDTVLGLVELLGSEAAVAPIQQDPRVAVLESIAALCAEPLQAHRIQQQQRERRQSQQLLDFAGEIFGSLDPETTAAAIADGTRRIVQCDRATVFERSGADYRALAVSGAAGVERRAILIQRLESLVKAVRQAGLPPMPLSRLAAQHDPQVHAALNAYLDASEARSVLVVPLPVDPATAADESRAECVGAIACDWFTERGDGHAVNFATLSKLSAQALRHARQFARVPWGAWWGKRTGDSDNFWRRRWRWLAGCACIAALFPLDFKVAAEGELQPLERRDVFAADDAVVEELHVEHGATVDAGDLLATLRSTRLDLERQRILGDLETARQRLGALEAARLGSVEGNSRADRLAPQLSGEEAGLREQFLGLERQSALLQEEFSQLSATAPIAGQVLTWDLSQRLLARPVQRGQALMTIGNPAGPWRLELRVPNRLIGYVPGAHGPAGAGPEVKFARVTEPATWRTGTVEQIAAVVDLDAASAPGVRVTARVESESGWNPRPGETVRARISCGWRPAVYVWLHELINGFRSWIQL